jgi:hypothetical protein
MLLVASLAAPHKNRTSWRDDYIHFKPDKLTGGWQHHLWLEVGVAVFDAYREAMVFRRRSGSSRQQR